MRAKDEPERATMRKVVKDDSDDVGSRPPKILLPVLRHGSPRFATG